MRITANDKMNDRRVGTGSAWKEGIQPAPGGVLLGKEAFDLNI